MDVLISGSASVSALFFSIRFLEKFDLMGKSGGTLNYVIYFQYRTNKNDSEKEEEENGQTVSPISGMSLDNFSSRHPTWQVLNLYLSRSGATHTH